ncbi:MAG: hypothetical protein KAU95_01090, partial [Candidatus Aenigmarchaeota archaeon]|nr:hypothetical protein [Candidatus Aenigmarchaeota archaeon]
EPILYVINPSGTLDKWNAKSLGRGEKETQKYLEKNYKEGMNEENAKKLAMSAIEQGEKKFGKFDRKSVEILVVKK